MGRGPAPGEFSEIRCRVCGINVQGKEATEEYRRISEEAQENALRMRCGDDPEYGEGPFLQKAIIVEETLSKTELKDRVAKKLRKNRRNKQVLTRSTFPLGTPGNLYMQARARPDLRAHPARALPRPGPRAGSSGARKAR